MLVVDPEVVEVCIAHAGTFVTQKHRVDCARVAGLERRGGYGGQRGRGALQVDGHAVGDGATPPDGRPDLRAHVGTGDVHKHAVLDVDRDGVAVGPAGGRVRHVVDGLW